MDVRQLGGRRVGRDAEPAQDLQDADREHVVPAPGGPADEPVDPLAQLGHATSRWRTKRVPAAAKASP